MRYIKLVYKDYNMSIVNNYLDKDVAYILGLIVARGEIIENKGRANIVITFPFRNLEAVGIYSKYDVRSEISMSVDKIVRRIRRIGLDVEKDVEENSVILSIELKASHLFMRLLKVFLKGKSHIEFDIPHQIFNANVSIKKEFMRGYGDVAGSIRKANVYKSGRHRVYLDVLNGNWRLPIQLCHILQDGLRVPVQTITWGHPNIRDSNLAEYKAGRKKAWAREHQIKIFAEYYLPVGFYIKHKHEILKELADYNKRKFPNAKVTFCMPPKKIYRTKEIHPAENDISLPSEIRGKHFDAYWQICCELGCIRCSKQRKLK